MSRLQTIARMFIPPILLAGPIPAMGLGVFGPGINMPAMLLAEEAPPVMEVPAPVVEIPVYVPPVLAPRPTRN